MKTKMILLPSHNLRVKIHSARNGGSLEELILGDTKKRMCDGNPTIRLIVGDTETKNNR